MIRKANEIPYLHRDTRVTRSRKKPDSYTIET